MNKLPDGWSVTWRDHQGETWPFGRSWSKDESHTQPDAQILQSKCDVRFQAYPPGEMDRAVLFVDYFVDRVGQRFLSVIFAHHVSAEVVWNEGKKFFLSGLDLLCPNATFVKWMANGTPMPKEQVCDPSALRSLDLPRLNYYVGVFFQVKPVGLLELEAQIGRTDGGDNLVSIVWCHNSSDDLLRRIVELIEQTSPTLKLYSTEVLFDLLKYMVGWAS